MKARIYFICGVALSTLINSSSLVAYVPDVISAPQALPELEIWADWRLPVRSSAPVTSCYGPRILLGRYSNFHKGVDFAIKIQSPVRSVAAGKVIWHGYAGCAGRTIVIEHRLKEKFIYSTYRHLKEFIATTGQRVKAGQMIARSGVSGRRLKDGQNIKQRGCVIGPHLHLEITQPVAGISNREIRKTLAVTRGHVGNKVTSLNPGLFLSKVRNKCSARPVQIAKASTASTPFN